MAESVREFDFQLARAILEQLVESFESLDVGQLSVENLRAVAHRQGIYQLFLNGVLVYIGKADMDLSDRLTRHMYTLSGRCGIDIGDCGFKGLYVHHNWAAAAHEDALIKFFQDQCEWNNSGFGSNDPGRERESTKYKPTHFDSRFPINLDWATPLPGGEYQIDDLLQKLKEASPYTFRFELDGRKRGVPHPELAGAAVVLPAAQLSVRAVLDIVRAALPAGWQATQLPGRVILYKEAREYTHGNLLWRSANA